MLESDYLKHDIEYRDPDDRECLRILVRLLQAVDQKDREAIKGMFSKEALENIEDIDEKTDLFIETFPAWECKYGPDFKGMGKHANRGTITKWLKPAFNFESDGRQYILKFIYYTDADENPDQLGLSMIQIFEKNEYLDTMTSEEVELIVGSDKSEAYFNKKLYSTQINHYYVALHELRFAYDYIEKNHARDSVVFEGVQVNYFDQPLLNGNNPDFVIFHLADDAKKTQMSIYLEVNGDEVTVINEDRT